MNHTETENTTLLKLCSLLLQYPNEEWIRLTGWREEIQKLTEPCTRSLLTRFLQYLDGSSMDHLCANYVETFDFNEKRSLHLTYHEYKNDRQRGQALVELKAQYRTFGYEMITDELPDYLPLMLEFCAIIGSPAIKSILYPEYSCISAIYNDLVQTENDYKSLFEICLSTINKSLRPKEVE